MLAAALRELFQIPYEHAKLMTDEQLLSLFEWNHIHHHALNKDEDWVDEHWNLEPLTIRGHRARTAKTDIPQIAKTKRIKKGHDDFVRRILAPRDERPQRQSKWPKRKFDKRKPS
jgi:hypothetical protein